MSCCTGDWDYKSHDTTPLRRHTRWARWNGERCDARRPICLTPKPSGGLQDGEHLSVAGAAIYLTGAKTNSEAAGKTDACLRGERRAAKERECKYFKRSVPLHHCWLCLIRWASTNNGRWDIILSQHPPPRKLTKCCWYFLSLLDHIKMCSVWGLQKAGHTF